MMNFIFLIVPSEIQVNRARGVALDAAGECHSPLFRADRIPTWLGASAEWIHHLEHNWIETGFFQ